VVTATKTGATKLQETPISITAFDEEALLKQVSTTLSDIADFSPNVSIWSASEGGDNKIFIRGIGERNSGVFAEANVASYVDGVYMEDGLGASMSDFVDIERVEVLRGPQGTLYGRNATGGAINIITKAPSDEFEGKVSFEAASFGKMRGDASVTGPIVEDTLLGRLSVSRTEYDSYMKTKASPGREPADLDGNDFTSVRGSLLFMPTDDLDIILRGDYQERNEHTYYSKYISSAQLGAIYTFEPDFHTIRLSEDFLPFYVTKSYGASGHIEWELSENINFRSITAYRKYDAPNDEYFEGDRTDMNLAQASTVSERTTFSQEIQLDGRIGSLEWITGAFYYDSAQSFNNPAMVQGYGFAVGGPAGSDLVVADGKVENDGTAYAVFGNVKYGFTESLKVSAGLRYSYEDKTGTSEGQVYEVWDGDTLLFSIPTSAPGTFDISADRLTPMVGAEYKINEDIMTYLTLANGFRAPSIAPGNFNVPIPELRNTDIESEIVWSAELGFKTDWMDNRLRVNLAGVYSKYDDMIRQVIYQVGGINQGVTVNAGEADIKALELEVMAMPLPALILTFNAAWLDAKFKEFNTRDAVSGAPISYSGNTLPFAPEYSASGSASYVFDMGNKGLFTSSLSGNWRSKVYFDDINLEETSTGSLILFNAFLRYETVSGGISVEAYCKNLADKEYYTDMDGRGTEISGVVGPPRTFGMRVTYNF